MSRIRVQEGSQDISFPGEYRVHQAERSRRTHVPRPSCLPFFELTQVGTGTVWLMKATREWEAICLCERHKNAKIRTRPHS